MKLQFFTVPAKWPEEAQQALNAFCLQHRVMTLEKHFVDLGDASFWSICVSFMDGSGQAVPGGAGNRRGQVDYREVLNAQDFRSRSHGLRGNAVKARCAANHDQRLAYTGRGASLLRSHAACSSLYTSV